MRRSLRTAKFVNFEIFILLPFWAEGLWGWQTLYLALPFLSSGSVENLGDCRLSAVRSKICRSSIVRLLRAQ